MCQTFLQQHAGFVILVAATPQVAQRNQCPCDVQSVVARSTQYQLLFKQRVCFRIMSLVKGDMAKSIDRRPTLARIAQRGRKRCTGFEVRAPDRAAPVQRPHILKLADEPGLAGVHAKLHMAYVHPKKPKLCDF